MCEVYLALPKSQVEVMVKELLFVNGENRLLRIADFGVMLNFTDFQSLNILGNSFKNLMS